MVASECLDEQVNDRRARKPSLSWDVPNILSSRVLIKRNERRRGLGPRLRFPFNILLILSAWVALMLFGDWVLVGLYSVEDLHANDNANMPDPVFSRISQRRQNNKLQDSLF